MTVDTVTTAGLTDPGPVLALVERAREVDGFSAVNEAGRLALLTGRGRIHVVAGPPERPVGYAGIELPPVGPGGSPPDATPLVAAEIVVDPAARGQGVGAALLAAVRDAAARRRPGAGVAVWAHQDAPAARRLATAAGMTAGRTLLLLRREPAPLPRVDLPAGVRLAAFRPGVDEQAWLAVNAAAFAAHPEQGRWDLADVLAREAEPWFDPAGFLLAWPEPQPEPERGSGPGSGSRRLLGFDWTKVPVEERDTTEPAVGEIYVLAVAPDAGVRGLGTALALAGLDHLCRRGIDTVELYVEADNQRALGVYRRLGFTERSRDVQWTVAGGPAR